MAFKDWQDTGNVTPLVLPIRGKEYRIPELGYLDGIRVREEMARIAEGGPAAATLSNDEFLAMILGDQLEQMRQDNVPPQAIMHAATVAHAFAFQGAAAAEQLWNDGPDPEALAAALRKVLEAAAASTTSPATPRRARTSSTKKPASTANTRSRTSKPARSSGTRSSRTQG